MTTHNFYQHVDTWENLEKRMLSWFSKLNLTDNSVRLFLLTEAKKHYDESRQLVGDIFQPRDIDGVFGFFINSVVSNFPNLTRDDKKSISAFANHYFLEKFLEKSLTYYSLPIFNTNSGVENKRKLKNFILDKTLEAIDECGLNNPDSKLTSNDVKVLGDVCINRLLATLAENTAQPNAYDLDSCKKHVRSNIKWIVDSAQKEFKDYSSSFESQLSPLEKPNDSSGLAELYDKVIELRKDLKKLGLTPKSNPFASSPNSQLSALYNRQVEYSVLRHQLAAAKKTSHSKLDLIQRYKNDQFNKKVELLLLKVPLLPTAESDYKRYLSIEKLKSLVDREPQVTSKPYVNIEDQLANMLARLKDMPIFKAQGMLSFFYEGSLYELQNTLTQLSNQAANQLANKNLDVDDPALIYAKVTERLRTLDFDKYLPWRVNPLKKRMETFLNALKQEIHAFPLLPEHSDLVKEYGDWKTNSKKIGGFTQYNFERPKGAQTQKQVANSANKVLTEWKKQNPEQDNAMELPIDIKSRPRGYKNNPKARYRFYNNPKENQKAELIKVSQLAKLDPESRKNQHQLEQEKLSKSSCSWRESRRLLKELKKEIVRLSTTYNFNFKEIHEVIYGKYILNTELSPKDRVARNKQFDKLISDLAVKEAAPDITTFYEKVIDLLTINKDADFEKNHIIPKVSFEGSEELTQVIRNRC